MADTTTLPYYDPVRDTCGADPYAVYRRLRDEAPVFHNPKWDMWALTRFDDVVAAAHDPQRFVSGKGVNVTTPPSEGSPLTSIISMDNPRHDQLRKLVARGFTTRQMGNFEPWIRTAARRLVDGFAERGEVEFVDAFGSPLPILVVSELLGIDEGDRGQFRSWSDAMVRQNPDDAATLRAAQDAVQSIVGYFSQVIEQRRRQPTDDLISLLLAAEVEGERLGEADILGFCFLLIVAGHETTTNLLGNTMVTLARHPDQRAELARDPGLIPQAIEELLRWCGSVHALGRATATDVELHGVTIPAGKRVALVFASANRDEREFGPDADRFDIHRTVPRHLAFGHGIHYCMGASLARLEVRIALEELLARMPDWHLTNDDVQYAPSSSVRGPLRLDLEFTPTASSQIA